MTECSKCGSPYHSDDTCPQALRRRKKSTFKTRKQMGLKDGALPFKYRVEIDPDKDNETEVIRKKSLLNLNSRRVYMQMGCAVKAYNSMRETAKWIANLFQNMDDEDRTAAAPVFMGMEGMLYALENLSNQKIAEAVKMEEVVERERKRARAARMRLARISTDKSNKAKQFGLVYLGSPIRDLPLFGNGGILDQMGRPVEEGKETSEGQR
jgi:hypothetical protein